MSLAALLRSLAPELHHGVFVFATRPDAGAAAAVPAVATVRESEGLSIVLREEDAAAAGVAGRFRSAWITLGVHSPLEAVGLTAAVANALAGAGIACNVVAGAQHDHLFVPVEQGGAALQVLHGLARQVVPAGGGGRPAARARRVPLDAILPMREEYRQAMACQIVHDSWHARGFTDSFLLLLGEAPVGYGAVGGAPGDPRHTVKEFFVRPAHRAEATGLFDALLAESRARRIEAQTNDVLLTLMLYDRAVAVTSPTILFADAVTTRHPAPDGAGFRRLEEADRTHVFEHTREPVGPWGLVEADGRVVATGGLMLHYNPPYADLFMEVAATHRCRGLGTYLVQELKRVCHAGGHVPAARCRHDNLASRRTLQRAGMLPCARVLHGEVVW
jgi:RimJ/RimL family protein N-acetyltransferase